MSIILSEGDFSRCSHDGALVLENTDPASITAEQTCSMLEQKCFLPSGEFTALQSRHEQLNASFDNHLSEIAQLRAKKRQTYSQLVEKDGEIERQLELLKQKDIVISQKNVTMKSCLDKIGVVKDITGAEQGVSNIEVMCRLCFNGEHEGSEKERKMLTCKSCDKKYHMSCLKAWAQNRDLFHWSSWTCPSCRTCEVCRRTGDPNKFMFCKRCDGAYHCYCQHPSYKNVSHGPYLCPKHTRCHSCGSNVPGNGLSVRWFLGYTCCHACGRLFAKGNYCPVCLRVYRDSEVTPMVCCDNCQRWVHCQCDGISDERYLQYQVNNNLQYKCAICRGESYQVRDLRDLEDAVQELWKRRDIFDRDLIANLRVAAGLPAQDEISSISPRDTEAERVSSVANCERLLQEKELMERQNILLNDELTKQFKSFNELCQAHNEFEADMSSKLADAEQYNPSLCALEWKQDRVKDPESQLTSLQELNASFD